MFEKITVVGDEMHPLYARITGAPAPVGGPIEWNFQKYLVNRRGEVVAKFSPRVKPEDPALASQVEQLLAEPAPAR
jgi:glutathione peroxidase